MENAADRWPRDEDEDAPGVHGNHPAGPGAMPGAVPYAACEARDDAAEDGETAGGGASGPAGAESRL